MPTESRIGIDVFPGARAVILECTNMNNALLSIELLRKLGLNAAGAANATFVVRAPAGGRSFKCVAVRCPDIASANRAILDLARETSHTPTVEVWWVGDFTPVRVWCPGAPAVKAALLREDADAAGAHPRT